MNKRVFTWFYVLFILFTFLYFSINSNPGWLKYADSHFYLMIARSWSEYEFILDDGTGAFVRPVAYLIYGIGYKIGGFNGIHLLSIILVFSSIVISLFLVRSSFVAISFLLLIFSSSFATYSNSILLQLTGLSLTILTFSISYDKRKLFVNRPFLLSLLLIVGILIHGGIIFLWISYLATLVVCDYTRYNENKTVVFSTRFLKSFMYFIPLLIILSILELYFDEKVFKSFFREAAFVNNKNEYYFGKFFYSIAFEVIRNLSVYGFLIVVLCVYGFIQLVFSIRRGSKLKFYSLWLFIYISVFEFLTILGVLKRDPNASEYYRTYFMAYPLFVFAASESFGQLISRLNNKFRKIIKLLFIVLFIFVLGAEMKEVGYKFDKSYYYLSMQDFNENKSKLNDKKILLFPTNIYTHRRFFSDSDFLGNNAIYYFDYCSKINMNDMLSNYNYVYLVKNQSLLDQRLDSKLIEKGSNCSPNLDYREILMKNGFARLFSSEVGDIYTKMK